MPSFLLPQPAQKRRGYGLSIKTRNRRIPIMIYRLIARFFLVTITFCGAFCGILHAEEALVTKATAGGYATGSTPNQGGSAYVNASGTNGYVNVNYTGTAMLKNGTLSDFASVTGLHTVLLVAQASQNVYRQTGCTVTIPEGKFGIARSQVSRVLLGNGGGYEGSASVSINGFGSTAKTNQIETLTVLLPAGTHYLSASAASSNGGPLAIITLSIYGPQETPDAPDDNKKDQLAPEFASTTYSCGSAKLFELEKNAVTQDVPVELNYSLDGGTSWTSGYSLPTSVTGTCDSVLVRARWLGNASYNASPWTSEVFTRSAIPTSSGSANLSATDGSAKVGHEFELSATLNSELEGTGVTFRLNGIDYPALVTGGVAKATIGAQSAPGVYTCTVTSASSTVTRDCVKYAFAPASTTCQVTITEPTYATKKVTLHARTYPEPGMEMWFLPSEEVTCDVNVRYEVEE